MPATELRTAALAETVLSGLCLAVVEARFR